MSKACETCGNTTFKTKDKKSRLFECRKCGTIRKDKKIVSIAEYEADE